MGFLDSLRMANIFGGSQPVGMPDLTAGGYNPDVIRESLNQAIPAINYIKNQDLNRAMSVRQQPLGAGDSPNMDRLRQMVSQGPPTVNGTTGPGVGVNYNPSQDSQSDMNVQKRADAASKTDDKNDLGWSKLAQGDQNLGIKQQRADTYDYQMRNPIGKIVNPLGGDYTKIDPRTGIPMDTGVATGTMTQEDKSDTDLRNKKDLQTSKSILDQYGADRKSDAASDLQDKKGTQSLAEIAARGGGKGSNSNKVMTPGQKAQQYKNNFQKLKQTDPNGLGKWITQNPDGSYGITAPADGYFGHSGPTQDEFNQLKQAIYGDDLSSQPGEQKSLPDPLGIRKPSSDDDGEE